MRRAGLSTLAFISPRDLSTMFLFLGLGVYTWVNHVIVQLVTFDNQEL